MFEPADSIGSSAATDADDLAAFIDKLHLGKVSCRVDGCARIVHRRDTHNLGTFLRGPYCSQNVAFGL